MMFCKLIKRLWIEPTCQSQQPTPRTQIVTVHVLKFLFLMAAVLVLTLICGTNDTLFQQLETYPRPSLKHISVGQGSLRIQPFNNNFKLNFENVCKTRIARNQADYLNNMRIRRRTISVEFYSNSSKDCDKFISNMGYITESSTQEEQDFPIAFGILVYKDVDQVERLLRAIYRPHNVYCIHIDTKSSPNFYNALKYIVSCLPNVWIASKRISVEWGTFTVLEPEIVCQRELYAHKTKWRYYINLTGQEFPLKTNYELVKILKSYQGANDIYGNEGLMKTTEHRINPEYPPPHHITVCKGPVHMTASRAFIQYVLFNQVAREFLEWCKTMEFPDESYFTSLNNNPHLKAPGSYTGEIEGVNRLELNRYKLWTDSKEQCGSRKYVREICILGMADLPILIKAPQLFANKFHYEFEPLAYDCLEWWYRKKVNDDIIGKSRLNLDIYKTASFVRHKLVYSR